MYNFKFLLEVFECLKKNMSLREIEYHTGVSRTTCSRWKKLYFNNFENLLKRYNKQHLNKEVEFLDSLDNEIFEYIKDLVKDNPFINHKFFITMINKKFNLKLDNKKIRFLLKNLKITKKRIRQRTIKSEKFLEEIVQNRKKFKEIIKNEIIDNIISIDESGFNKLLNENTKGYSEKGVEINMPINELKIKNTSLLMALSVFGIINYNTTLESIDTNIYFNFIDDTIKKLKKINPTTIFIFIFDNVSFHKDNRIYDLIINNGYKIYYIPPYSPNLNPIENTFGILKNEINNDILNDIVNNNFFNNYDKTKKENNENIKKSNKNLKIEEKKKEALKILEFKENNKKEFNNLINVQITNIKKDKNIEKKEINEKIKKIKVKNKEEKYLKQKEYITNEKNNTKIRILNNKTPKSTILKKYIENNIKKFNEKYKKEQILKIYEHAFNYEYQDIEKELRDRIKIKK
jgi:transposase/uncharacterized protein YerC